MSPGTVLLCRVKQFRIYFPCMMKTAQDIQDDIFRKMTADEKSKVWAGLWILAKDLASNKITHGTDGSKNAFDKHRTDF